MTPNLTLTQLPGTPALPEWSPTPLGCFTGLAVLALVLGMRIF